MDRIERKSSEWLGVVGAGVIAAFSTAMGMPLSPSGQAPVDLVFSRIAAGRAPAETRGDGTAARPGAIKDIGQAH
jgi:hypothetical protein